METLESRQVMATAGGVENILLPEFIAQMADPNGNQLPASDAWWALRSQRNMALDEPISKVMNFAAHNAFNALNEGFFIVPELAPNQLLSLSGQLDVGARSIELDIHDPLDLAGRMLILKHNFPPAIVSRARSFSLDEALLEIRNWLDRPENQNEIIYLDFEDATEQNEDEADDPLLPKLDHFFKTRIYTPEDRASDGHWPSRAELISRDKRVVIFSHRNDEFHGRFGEPQEYTDPNGHVWYGTSMAFRANGKDDPVSDRGNYTQVSIDDFSFTAGPSEDADSFFSVQSDGIRNATARRYQAADVANAAALNVDFLKMDFLFTDDEDADLGLNAPLIDPFYDIPQDNRIELLEKAVWSWAKNDPAVDRQMFQNLRPGDGTAAAMFNLIATRVSPEVAANLAEIGAAARQNGLDVAVQHAGRWVSASTSAASALPFAARSVQPNSAGEYQWRVTQAVSTNWFDGDDIVQQEFGSGFVFAGPVNGFQNRQLHEAASGADTWIHVHDFDHDGNWQVGNRAPQLNALHVQPAVSEGDSVQLTVDFSDDPERHVLNIQWGDGSLPTVMTIEPSQNSVVVAHIFRDDNPTATPADSNLIQVTLTDAGGLSASASAHILVRNQAPEINAIASNATFANPGAEGQRINFSASFSDVGAADTHQAGVDWGDGSSLELVTLNQGAGTGTVAGTHAYANGGIYTITLTLTDDDTDAATATATAVITGVGVNHNTLFIIGGRSDDHASVSQTGNGLVKVRSNFSDDRSRDFAAAIVSRIIAYLGEGHDHLSVANNVLLPMVAHGGGGNDELDAGSGPSALIGDAGNDRLNGHGGRNLLIGGIGSDVLVAGTRGDVLVGGSTNVDQDDHALFVALGAWGAVSDYATRVDAVAALLAVLDDDNADRLTGGAAADVFYDGDGDVLKPVKSDERVLH